MVGLQPRLAARRNCGRRPVLVTFGTPRETSAKCCIIRGCAPKSFSKWSQSGHRPDTTSAARDFCRGLPDGSCLVSFGHMGIPGAAGFRRDVGKSRARGWIGDADQVLARRALNLPAGVLGFAFQGLITVGTVEFEFVRAHGL